MSLKYFKKTTLVFHTTGLCKRHTHQGKKQKTGVITSVFFTEKQRKLCEIAKTTKEPTKKNAHGLQYYDKQIISYALTTLSTRLYNTIRLTENSIYMHCDLRHINTV